MGSILNEADRAAILRRLGTVNDASAARWGRMNVQAMLTHLSRAARMALGELPVACKGKRAFQVFPLKQLLLHVAPFPKGAPTAPELLVAEAGSVDATRAELRTLIDRIGTGPRDGAGPPHPLFGPLTRQEWGVATYKHIDHHLRQFGA